MGRLIDCWRGWNSSPLIHVYPPSPPASASPNLLLTPLSVSLFSIRTPHYSTHATRIKVPRQPLFQHCHVRLFIPCISFHLIEIALPTRQPSPILSFRTTTPLISPIVSLGHYVIMPPERGAVSVTYPRDHVTPPTAHSPRFM